MSFERLTSEQGEFLRNQRLDEDKIIMNFRKLLYDYTNKYMVNTLKAIDWDSIVLEGLVLDKLNSASRSLFDVVHNILECPFSDTSVLEKKHSESGICYCYGSRYWRFLRTMIRVLLDELILPILHGQIPPEDI